MIKGLFCLLVLAAVYFMARGFLDTADSIRAATAEESSSPAPKAHRVPSKR